MHKFFFVTALLAAQTVFAQKSHVLKISTIEPIFKMAHLSYEYHISPQWSLELMARYNWGVGAYTYPTPGEDLTQQVLSLMLSQRFCPFSRREDWMKGLLFGAYLREDWLVSSSWQQYPDLNLFQEYTAWRPVNGRSVRAGAGLLWGYKKRWGNHLLTEFNWGYDLNLGFYRPGFGLDIAGIIALKVGWQF